VGRFLRGVTSSGTSDIQDRLVKGKNENTTCAVLKDYVQREVKRMTTVLLADMEEDSMLDANKDG